MLTRTITRTKYIFGGIILLIIGYSIYYAINQPNYVSANSKFIGEVSFFQTHGNKNSLMVVNWGIPLNKSTASNIANFKIEQVIPDGRNWKTVTKGKKCQIGFIQYVYAPWVDTEEKRKKAEPSERNKKVTQLSVYIEPREEIDDYFKITVKNIEATTGEKLEKEEYGVVKITRFNKLIKS